MLRSAVFMVRDDQEVGRDQQFVAALGEPEGETALVLLDECDELAEDFRDVPTIDFVDQHDVVLARVCGCSGADFFEDAVAETSSRAPEVEACGRNPSMKSS